MSQTGYLVAAFAIVVAVLVVWAGIIGLKLVRLRREAASADGAGRGGNG